MKVLLASMIIAQTTTHCAPPPVPQSSQPYVLDASQLPQQAVPQQTNANQVPSMSDFQASDVQVIPKELIPPSEVIEAQRCRDVGGQPQHYWSKANGSWNVAVAECVGEEK